MDIRPVSNTAQPAVSVVEGAPITESSSASKPAPVQTASAVAQVAPPPNTAELAQAVRNINKAMDNMSLGLEFSIDSHTQHTIVKVIDQQTKEVIRQMPSEEALQISRTLDQVQGLLIKQKV